MTEPQRFFVFATFAKYKYRYICYIPDPLRSFSTPPWLLPYSLKLFAFPASYFTPWSYDTKRLRQVVGLVGIERRVRDHFIGVFQERNWPVAIFFVFHGIKDRGCLLSRQPFGGAKGFPVFSAPCSGISAHKRAYRAFHCQSIVMHKPFCHILGCTP